MSGLGLPVWVRRQLEAATSELEAPWRRVGGKRLSRRGHTVTVTASVGLGGGGV